MSIYEKFNGGKVDGLKNIAEISNYNRNYYIYEKELIYGDTNDNDASTEWFLIRGAVTTLLGMSFLNCLDSEPEIIMTDECYRK